MMGSVFWKFWAVLFVLSIFWLGWCIKTSPPAQAELGTQEVKIVSVSGTLPVDITKVDGKKLPRAFGSPDRVLPVTVVK